MPSACFFDPLMSENNTRVPGMVQNSKRAVQAKLVQQPGMALHWRGFVGLCEF